MTGVEFADSALSALGWRGRARDRDRMARVRASSTGPRSRGAMRGSLVVDGRNCVDREAVRAAGFTYEGIGR